MRLFNENQSIQNEVRAEMPQPNVSAAGAVKPPSDLLAAAKASMDELSFQRFRKQHPNSFTPAQLCAFVDSLEK